MTEDRNSVVRTRPMRLSETDQVPSGRKTTKKNPNQPQNPTKHLQREKQRP